MKTAIKPIYTSRDAARAHNRNYDKYVVWNDLHEKASIELKRIMDVLSANPEIGVLMRDGVAVYYINSPIYAEAANPDILILTRGLLGPEAYNAVATTAGVSSHDN